MQLYQDNHIRVSSEKTISYLSSEIFLSYIKKRLSISLFTGIYNEGCFIIMMVFFKE